MAITQQYDFLSQITPFDQLDKSILFELADSMNVVYLPKRTKLNLEEIDDAGFLYIIIKGKVAELQDDAIISRYSVRGFFGDYEVLGKMNKSSTYEAIEETITYKLPAKIFMKAFNQHDKFSRFFSASIVDKLDRIHKSIQSATSTEVMMDTVCNAHIQNCVAVSEQATLLQVAQKMIEVKSDACLIEFDDGSVGIVTSSDVLMFVATEPHELLSSTGVLNRITTKPVHSIHEFDYMFNALLKMTRYQIDRLVVRSDDGFIGFLHQKDLMSMFANQSGLVLLKVGQADGIDDLIQVGPQIEQLVHSLSRKGIKTHYIAKLVNELHRKMIYKLISFLLPSELSDKVCILVMGSEGRSEQVIRTDQDNALIYHDEISDQEIALLDAFAIQFNEAMQQLGFPPCLGNIMLSNTEWRHSLSGFKDKVDQWFKNPSDEHFMYASILLDGEVVYGAESWLVELKSVLRKRQEDYPVFLRHFAIAALRFNTPIGFFGGLITDNEDKEHSHIDIKKGGIFSIVHGVRCYALEAGVEQTNTHWRIKVLMDKGIFTKAFGIELGETLNYLNTLRLESMLQQLSEGQELPNNKVKLAALSHMQQDILKQSFAVVDAFKKRITQHFNLQEML